LTETIVKLALKSVIFPFDASTFQFPERTYCAFAVVLFLLTIRELILPVALKFPVGFVGKEKVVSGLVSSAALVAVILLLP